MVCFAYGGALLWRAQGSSAQEVSDRMDFDRSNFCRENGSWICKHESDSGAKLKKCLRVLKLGVKYLKNCKKQQF